MDPRLIALVALLLLTGCATFGVPAGGSLCPVGPFIADPGAAQRLTRAEKEYVVLLNNSGERICGWTAPTK